MSKEIKVRSDRKVIVEEKDDKYFALQTSTPESYPIYHTLDKFKFKEDAQKKAKDLAIEMLHQNESWIKFRIIYVEELEYYERMKS